MRRAPLIVIAVYAAYLVWVIGHANWGVISRFWDLDDAYFYLTIARNLAMGMGSTFDGLSQTNGYQPLWMSVLVVAFKVTGAVSSTGGIQLAFALAGLCVVGGALVLSRLVDRLGGSPLVRIASVLGVFSVSGFWFFGLEAQLNVLVAAAFFTALWTRWESLAVPTTNARMAAWPLALASTAMVLTRLDLFVWVTPVLFALAVARHRGGWSRARVVRAALVEQGVPLVCVLAYLAMNKRVFGVWMPISAMLRSKSPGVSLDAAWLHSGIELATLAVLMGGALAILIVAAMTGGMRANLGRRLGFGALLGGGVLAQCVVSTLIASEWGPRYVLTASLATIQIWAILASEAARRWPGAVSRAINAAVAVCCGVVAIELTMVAAHHASSNPLPGSVEAQQFRTELAAHVTPESRVFMVDDSGEFGWFCGCHVINGDGLVNDWTFQRFVAERRVKDYLDAQGVNFVVHIDGDAEEGVIWLQGVDWRSRQEFPIVGYRESAQRAHVGPFRLFPYPDGAITPDVR